MDFFEHQAQAKKRTAQLIVLFILAVIGTVLVIDAVFFLIAQPFVALADEPASELNPIVFKKLLELSYVVIGFILMGAVYKLFTLRTGGRAIADALGGRLISQDANDAQERQLLNVTEEMAIASGTPVPPVYILDRERGMNAFAAGYSPKDAVIIVTQGLIDQLNRDELQGVIAHEFSHILNGDIALSIRLVGALHGVLIFSIAGKFLLHNSFKIDAGRRIESKEGGALAFVIGLPLAIAGSIGHFFASMVQSAVSRQREYLADASAIQFTRNPDGIGGALIKIRDHGSRIHHPLSIEFNHMFIAETYNLFASKILPSHPPITNRIHRIYPNGVPDAILPRSKKSKTTTPSQVTPEHRVAGIAALSMAIAHTGQPTSSHMDRASELIQSIPEVLKAATKEPFSARAVIYAALLNKDNETRAKQLVRLKDFSETPIYRETLSFESLVHKTPREALMPLISLTLPALKEMSKPQYARFQANIKSLIEADEWIDLFEWVLQKILMAHLKPHFEGRAKAKVKYHQIDKLKDQCEVLLSNLARAGHAEDKDIAQAFEQAATSLPIENMTLKPLEQCKFGRLNLALDILAQLDFKNRRKLIDACVICIAADKQVTLAEGELLRAICETLACPMPPLLPGQDLSA